MKYDYIIIGSGLGGLCAAIILAKENKKVLVLEQHFKAGGYLHSFYRKGHRFESGFHFVPALDNDQILSMYWKYLGILDKLDIIPYNRDFFHSLIFPDHQIKLPSGLDQLQNTLCRHFPDQAQKIAQYINKMKEIKTYFIYFNQNHRGDLAKEHASFEISIMQYLNSLELKKELKAILLAHTFLYGVPPSETPLGTHAIFFNALYSPIYDIKGGGDALINALVQSLKENGGEILLKKKVTHIKTENRTIIGVETEDECFYSTQSIVCGTNPQAGLDLFDHENQKNFRKTYYNRIKEMENSCSHFALYLTTGAQIESFNYDTLYFPDYDLDHIYQKPVSALPDDFFLYFTVPTARQGASKNRHIIETLSIDDWENYQQWFGSKAKQRPADYYHFKTQLIDLVLKKLTHILPGIKDKIEIKEASTPLTNYDYTGSPQGSIYGLKHNMQQMHAPVRARTKLNGFYFTGQSLIFPGIVGVTITGFVTCADILGQEYLFNRIDQSIP